MSSTPARATAASVASYDHPPESLQGEAVRDGHHRGKDSRARLEHGDAIAAKEEAIMADLRGANPSGNAGTEPGPNLSLINTQLSWMRSELSNVRTLLAWVRTAVSMIGFGFTIYNFYRGFLEDLAGGRGADSARNLGLSLVAAGTLAMVIALWNYRGINQSLEELDAMIGIPQGLRRRWIYSYVLAAVVMAIGLITLLFMLRVI
jgi:putative membrane protein